MRLDKPVIPILDALEELEEEVGLDSLLSALTEEEGEAEWQAGSDLLLRSPEPEAMTSRIRLKPRKQSPPKPDDEHSSPQDLEEHADDVLVLEERERPLGLVDFQDPYSTPAPADRRRTATPNENDFPSFPTRPSPTVAPSALANSLLAGDRMPQRAPALKLRRRMRPRVSRSPANNEPLAFPEVPTGGFSLSSFPAQPRIVSPEATASR